MIPVLTIFDDFLPDNWAAKLREEVLADGFTTEYIEEAKGYPPTPYYTVNTKIKHNQIFDLIGHGLGFNVKPHLQAYRLGAEGSHLHNLVHAGHTCAQLAAVMFLNPQEQCPKQSGTAFWRHAKHGWHHMPTQEEFDAAGYTIEELAKDWHDATKWELVSLAGMRNNRMIVYPASIFHSRWPWTGFGKTPEESRLVWVGFFDVLDPLPRQ